MAQGVSLRVDNLQGFLKACSKADKETRFRVRATFRKVGEPVRRDAAAAISPVSPKTAAGYKTIVRQRGVAVEQSLKKTTGTQPHWGATQMRVALLPAMEDNEAETLREFEQAMDKVCDHFERGPS